MLWSLGSLTEVQFLVCGSALQHILRKVSRQNSRQKLPARVDRESAEEGSCGDGPEVHVAEVVPHNFCRRNVSIPEGTELDVLNAGTILGVAAHAE